MSGSTSAAADGSPGDLASGSAAVAISEALGGSAAIARGVTTAPGATLAWEGVVKRFGGVEVLHGVSLSVGAGSCHALVGENGAGKSTLAALAAGIHRPDGGRVVVAGRPRRWRSPADAVAAGVALVHQELPCCAQLSVAESLFLGRWPRRGPFVDRRALASRAAALLAAVELAVDPRASMGRLSVAQRQLVQIAAAVGTGAGIVIFDEPSASLSDAEAEGLFALVGRLRRAGTTLVYVSHRLPEVLALCDRMTVLRDGAVVDTLERGQADEERLLSLMLGGVVPARPAKLPQRAAAAQRRPAPSTVGTPPGAQPSEVRSSRASPPVAPPGPALPRGAPRLRLADIAVPGGPAGVSLQLQAGEIVGLAGLLGAGRSELLAALFGLRPRRGEVAVDGRVLAAGDVGAAVAAGLGLVPEDRQRQGLVPGLDALVNQSLPSLPELTRGGLLDLGAERARAGAALERVGLTARPGLPVSALSGGNQQKVVLARWIDRRPRVLLVDEPTRGVDLGAKAAIHAELRALAGAGTALLLASSELPEILALCTRVIVLREGRVVAELAGAALDERAVLAAMAGVGPRPTVGAPA